MSRCAAQSAGRQDGGSFVPLDGGASVLLFIYLCSLAGAGPNTQWGVQAQHKGQILPMSGTALKGLWDGKAPLGVGRSLCSGAWQPRFSLCPTPTLSASGWGFWDDS